MYLEEASTGYSNNLGFIKFLAAVAVIFSHAFSVTRDPLPEPLALITRNQITFGGFAVAVFFFASGFYVTKSIMKRGGTGYWKGRLTRIYPSFIVVIAATALIMGPVVTSLSLTDYFTSPQTYSYFMYLIMVPRYSLPGVFQNNPLTTVNGSLWTIILEMICYLALFTAYKMKLLDQKILKFLNILLVAAILILFGIKPGFVQPFNGYIRPVFIFVMGVEFCVFKDRIRLNNILGLVLLAAAVVLCVVNRLDLAMVMIFPYLLSLIVFTTHQVGKTMAKLGDYSYGMYLTAFPIQQIIVNYWPDVNVLWNTLITAVTSLVMAVLLLKCVEGPVSDRVLKKKS